MMASIFSSLLLTAVGCGDIEIDAQENNVEYRNVKSITVPMNNCGGGTRIEINQTYRERICSHIDVRLDSGIDVSLRGLAEVKLNTAYGYDRESCREESTSVSLTAAPYSNVTYHLALKSARAKGYFYNTETSEKLGKYEINKGDLKIEVSSSEKRCI